MWKLQRNTMAAAGAVVLTAGLSLVTQGSAAAAYAPGTATAIKPTYSVNAGGYNYHCSYAHWRSGAKVTWKCELHERYINDLGFLVDEIITTKSGSWTPAPATHTTPTYLRKLTTGDGELCVVARALSVDGGAVSAEKCQG